LHNITTLINIFEYRCLLLVQKSVGKLAERVDKKDHLFDAWNNSQSYFIQHLIRAYSELFCLKGFLRINEVIKDTNTKIMLDKFLVLFALNSIETDIGVLRENDYITSEAYDLIKSEILDLCSDLSKEFISIMDVITPPDSILSSPLGASDDDNFDKYISHVFNAKGCFERAEYWDTILTK